VRYARVFNSGIMVWMGWMGAASVQADALTIKFRQILKKIVDAKTKMGSTMKTSAFALTEAKYAAGDQVRACALVERRGRL
jgi:vacuolar-type H+-ATPase subunit D/Vma8